MGVRKGYRQCSKCKRNRAHKFFVSERGRVCESCRKQRVRFASREVRLWETYGITLEEYAAIVVAQGGGCGICGGKRRGNMDVDHSHSIERALVEQGVPPRLAVRRSVRGVLCRRCNRRLLPAVLDDPQILLNGEEYLFRWPADAVLGAELPCSP